MSNQKRTIMGSCDFSIETLKNLKRDMSNIGGKNGEILWALGGIICAMTSSLLQICDQVFNDPAQLEDDRSAEGDMKLVQTKFNEFMDRMIDNA